MSELPSSSAAELNLHAEYPDALESDPWIHQVVEDTESHRVFSVNIPPGYRSQAHTHPTNVTVVLNGGLLRVEAPEQEPKVLMFLPGQVLNSTGGPHIIQNVGDTEIHTYQVEFKGPPPEGYALGSVVVAHASE
jgi:hypothetical protein